MLGAQPGVVEHVPPCPAASSRRFAAQAFNQVDKIRQRRRARSPATAAGGLPQAAMRQACIALDAFDGAGANAAGGEVDHPQQRTIVVAIRHQAQVGQRVFDFLAFEEAQAAINLGMAAGGKQRVLDDARLGIGAVQHRDIVEMRRPRVANCLTSSTMNCASSRSAKAS